MSPFLYILMGIMALYILCDIIQKCNNKKPSKPVEPEKPSIRSKMVEQYGGNITIWFRYGNLVFWVYSDSVNELNKSNELKVRNIIIKTGIDKIQKTLDESCYKDYNGNFNIFVPLINDKCKEQISWDYKFIATDDELLGTVQKSSKQLAEDISKLISEKE